MDIFKIMNWFEDNKKKLRILSHVILIATIINLVVAMYTGSFASNTSFYIFCAILQLVVFTLLQYRLKDQD